MMTGCFPINRAVARRVRPALAALALAAVGAVTMVDLPASAQNLLSNGTFAVTGGSTSFDFGGYFAYGGPSSESLASWAYIPSGTGANAGAAFDFASGATTAYYNGSTSTILPSAITAPGGGNFVAMDANWSGGNNIANPGISQTVSGLTIGTTYTLSFAYALTQWAGYGSTGNVDSFNWIAMLGTSSQSTPTVSISTQGGFSGWATATFTYVATATSETLQLLAANGSGVPPMALVANVSLAKAPEPMSIAVLGTGIAGLLAAARRRRTPALRT